jgi:hypothetical protein
MEKPKKTEEGPRKSLMVRGNKTGMNMMSLLKDIVLIVTRAEA